MKRLILTATLLLAGLGLAADDISFSELYTKSVLGLKFSDKVRQFSGKSVSISGFMAPPLRIKGNFFVLTAEPVSLCPFCQSDADWPQDIIVVYLSQDQFFDAAGRSLLVTGTLSVGSFTDPTTGFVSQLRLMNARYSEQ